MNEAVHELGHSGSGSSGPTITTAVVDKLPVGRLIGFGLAVCGLSFFSLGIGWLAIVRLVSWQASAAIVLMTAIGLLLLLGIVEPIAGSEVGDTEVADESEIGARSIVSGSVILTHVSRATAGSMRPNGMVVTRAKMLPRYVPQQPSHVGVHADGLLLQLANNRVPVA